jgi:hypothetical protein
MLLAVEAIQRNEVELVPWADRHGKVKLDPAISEPLGYHLRLTGGLAWPVLDHELLFVRSFQQALFEGPLNRCQPVPRRHRSDPLSHYVWTGTRGHGKSTLALYLIYRIISAAPTSHPTIVYQVDYKKSGCQGWVITPNGVSSFTSPAHPLVIRELREAGTILISDALPPPTVGMHPQAVVLLIGSPGAVLEAKPFLVDRPAYLLQAPLFTEDDCWELHNAAYSHLPTEGVKARLQLWGPNPRHVFNVITKSMQQWAWDSLQSVTLEQMWAAAHQTDGQPSTSAVHRIVQVGCAGQRRHSHRTPSTVEYYHRGDATFVSPAVLACVLPRMMKEKRPDLLFMVNSKSLADDVTKWVLEAPTLLSVKAVAAMLKDNTVLNADAAAIIDAMPDDHLAQPL